jgi:hypothetical protein
VFPLAHGGSGMDMSGTGATAENFVLPLIIGISILAFIMTATLALSPTHEELLAEAALMERIQSSRIEPHLLATPPRMSSAGWQGPAGPVSRAEQARRKAAADGAASIAAERAAERAANEAAGQPELSGARYQQAC